MSHLLSQTPILMQNSPNEQNQILHLPAPTNNALILPLHVFPLQLVWRMLFGTQSNALTAPSPLKIFCSNFWLAVKGPPVLLPF
eukprot:1208898-Ditylum_brightwellii.AAC.1